MTTIEPRMNAKEILRELELLQLYWPGVGVVVLLPEVKQIVENLERAEKTTKMAYERAQDCCKERDRLKADLAMADEMIIKLRTKDVAQSS